MGSIDQRFNPQVQFRNYKIVYRRYAGLYFCLCVDANDNELAYLEAIHLFVEILGTSYPTPHFTALCITWVLLSDSFFDNVCELDLVFNFYKVHVAEHTLCSLFYDSSSQVYAILDEIFLAGEIEETSKDVVLSRLEELEKLE